MATRTNAGKVITIDRRAVQLCREGWPDITAVIEGKFVGIETKQATGWQRESQRKAQEAIEAAGGVYLLVNKIGVLRNYLGVEG
jgi:hypothetical protein